MLLKVVAEAENQSQSSSQKTRKCRVCKCQTIVWPSRSPNCSDCKQALDKLALCALKEDQMDWWKKACADKNKLHKLVERYLQDRQKQTASKTRRPFNLTEYVEEEAASGLVAETSNHSRTEIMHETNSYILHKHFFLRLLYVRMYVYLCTYVTSDFMFSSYSLAG
jgi:hypothetical protein